ncbi:hypothetical protein AX17_000917 [Amanita inopinata Kibby_2008]|nr:hypothetical protein AX17_000917 [Amanita inopinata Kibby_2008]
MAGFKLLNLLALSSLAIFASTFGPCPVNALSIDTSSHHFARHAAHAHDAIVKKRRETNVTRKCKPRPSSSPVVQQHASVQAPQPPKATTAAPHPTAPVNTNTGNRIGKVGIAYPESDPTPLKHFKNQNVGPLYTWSPWIPELARQLGYEGIPMLWGEKQVEDFKNLVKPGYAKYVMGFNEPNEASQSAMDPGRAATLWKAVIDPLKTQGYTLISPACTNGLSGKQWIEDFIKACNGCQIDAIALHYYGTSAQDMIKYLIDFHQTFQRPIWVTEFACQDFSYRTSCSRGDIFNFMGTVKAFMDKTDWVAHYFAFGVMHDMYNVNPLNQLLAPSGEPTQLGYLYIS